ncbi:MAG: ABC transporter ATP-binding protein/permease [Hyphomonadaceae bacterium]
MQAIENPSNMPLELARAGKTPYVQHMTRHHAHAGSPDNPDQIESADGGIAASVVRVVGVLARPELKRWRPIMLLAVILTLGAKVVAVAAPLYLGHAINALEGGSTASETLSASLLFLLFFTGGRLLSAALPQLRDWFFSPVSQDAQRIVCVDAFGHAQNLSLGFHQTRRTGALNRIIERGAGAVDYLLRFIAFNIGPTIIELCLAAALLAVAYDVWLAVIAVVTVVGYGVFTFMMTEWRVRQRRRMNEADTELRAKAVDSLNNFETVKAFAAEERETEHYNAAMKTYNRRYIEASRSLNLLNAGQEFIMNAGLLSMMGFAAFRVWQGSLQIGAIAAVMMLMMNLYRPLNILGWAWREIKQGAVDLEKLYGLMGMKSDVSDKPDAAPLDKPKGEVRFEDVSFSHKGRSAGIDDVSFHIPPGRKLAFVGTSGAGKSTLLKLLFRFYDVSSGRVLVDGVDVRDVQQTSLRQSLGLVPQDVVLFNDTLRANIAYGRPEANQADLDDAANRAQLGDFIARLPDGWDTRVGERGLKLSGGEKQRVGIARVILNNPAILVLDEATSALDTATEQAVQSALEAASQGRTTLMVAHRLSTVKGADEIIVLDEGRIVERGTHNALLALDGKYTDMWQRQIADMTARAAAE